jgi:membrane-bound lytic murein transglycosylase D
MGRSAKPNHLRGKQVAYEREWVLLLRVLPRPLRLSFCLTMMARAACGADPAAPPPPVAGNPDELYKAAQQLFEQLATPEIKAQFEFPTKAQWDEFAARFMAALQGDSLEELAAYAPQARGALTALRTMSGNDELADWLEQRIDEIEGAKQALAPTPPRTPKLPTRPGAPAPTSPVQLVPHYDLWMARVRDRPLPARAAALMPKLRAAFVAEGVPPELAWLAEAESSLNPAAKSPAGAKGLFQFMPDTAKAMGLSTLLPDERTDPEKSARAAARYLRSLHGRFGNWALALAAYNAGEGRVSRTLDKQRANTFTAIADALPAETRMYVPKVCALIATRAGVTPDKLARPRSP